MATFRCHQSESPLFSKKGFQWYYSRSIFFCALPFFGWFDVPYSTTDTFDVDGHFRCGSHVPRVWDSFLLHSCWISQDDSRCAVPTKKTMCDWMPFQGAKFWGNKFEIANSKIAERMLVWLVWLCTFTYIINSCINHNFMPFLLDQREFFQLS